MFKKILLSFFLTLFFTDVGLIARPRGGRRGSRGYRVSRPYHRHRRYYYGSYNYWPAIATIATTGAILSAANKDNEKVIVVKRPLKTNELEMEAKIKELELELQKQKDLLKKVSEKKESLPKDLEEKLNKLEKISKELKDSLEKGEEK